MKRVIVFLCHRPRYFGKACTSIVTYSFAASNQIVKYLDTLALTLGFNVVKGIWVRSADERSEKDQQKIERARTRQAKRFYAGLVKPAHTTPPWLMLIVFRMFRNGIRQSSDITSRDYQYYAQKGWLESDYYYPTRLGLLKKLAGKIFDILAVRKILA